MINELVNEAETDESLAELDHRYLTFNVGKEGYGIKISFVTEIISLQTITPVPDTASFVKGVINLRGKVIPIIDVRLRFGMEEIPYADRTCIIVVKHKNYQVGLIIDNVSEVIDIPEDKIERAAKGEGDRGNFVTGIGKLNEQVKMLLDVERLISQEEEMARKA